MHAQRTDFIKSDFFAIYISEHVAQIFFTYIYNIFHLHTFLFVPCWWLHESRVELSWVEFMEIPKEVQGVQMAKTFCPQKLTKTVYSLYSRLFLLYFCVNHPSPNSKNMITLVKLCFQFPKPEVFLNLKYLPKQVCPLLALDVWSKLYKCHWKAAHFEFCLVWQRMI